jgi:hypothetical protein
MTAPKLGDRVRIVVEGVVKAMTVNGPGPTMAFVEPDGARNGEGFAVTQLGTLPSVSVEVIAPAESWQAGDVVRNADDPDDMRAWGVEPRPGKVGTRVRFVLLGDPDVDYLDREDLPDRLTLLVRDGRLVLPEIDDHVLVDWIARHDDIQTSDKIADWRKAIADLDWWLGVRRP